MSSARKPPAAGELHVWRVEPAGDDRRAGARRALAAILAEYLGGVDGAADRSGGGAACSGAAATTGGAKEAAAEAAQAEDARAGAGMKLCVGQDGKPRLAVAPERLSFNLSHSGDLALVAIAPGGVEVGVDLERLRPRRDLVRLAERRLPTADAAAVADAAEGPEREAAFYAAWTRHEARVKCTGSGLGGPAPGPEVVAVQLPIDPGYAAAVAVAASTAEAERPRVTLRTWEPGAFAEMTG
jgi:hypothetical protein